VTVPPLSLRCALAAVLLSVALPAGAGSKQAAVDRGPAYRTTEECTVLPGTKKAGERAACFHCVQRRDKHAYHFEMKPGKRCRVER